MITDTLRGGGQIELTYLEVSHTAHAQYASIVGEATREEIRDWITNNTQAVTKMSDSAPYYLFVSHGFRFVFVSSNYMEEPGAFMLVAVQLAHGKGKR